MDKDRFISLSSNPDHPIHAATAYMASLETRKPQKAKGWLLAIGFIVAITAMALAIIATA